MKSLRITNYRKHKICGRKGDCLSVPDKVESLINKTVIFQDYRPTPYTNANLNKINSLGLPIRFYSWNHYSRILYRIFDNPKKELKDQIVSITKDIPFQNVTTIHILNNECI